MTFKRRFKLSEQQRNDMWRRWKAGQSLHEIGRVFGKDQVSIQFMLAQQGGIAPTVRRRSPVTLTLAEREDISRGIACGSSIREIAKGLQRAVSTVSREVARHGGRPLDRATDADQKAWESALRPRACILALHVNLQEIVAGKLILNSSPEQVSGWLKTEYPEVESWLVSAGRDRRPGSPLNVPPWPASNFVLGEHRAYSRDDGTPSWEALEEIIGGLESGSSVSFASGMAGIAAIFDQLPAGSVVALPDDCYQGVAGLAKAGETRIGGLCIASPWPTPQAGSRCARWQT